MQYNFDKIIDRNGTSCLKFDGREIFNMDEDMLPMWIADMDFPTCNCVHEAVIKRANHHIYGYNYGSESYYNSVINWMKKRHGLDVTREEICLSPGVVTALAMLLKSMLNQGESVIIQPPVYPPFKNIALLNNYKVVENNLILKNNKFYIDFEDFEQKIIEHKVKVFLLCNPHNPVCRVWTKDELFQLASICLKHGVKIISDEIHSDIVFAPSKHIPIASLSQAIDSITITCTAPSKTFNLAGIKVSNIIIKDKMLRKNYLEECEKLDMVSLNTFAYPICESVYTYGEDWLSHVLNYIKGNYDLIKSYLEQYIPALKLVEPEATYLAWINCRALGLSNSELKQKLINDGKLWVEYGDEFGGNAEGFIRINIATPRQNVKMALDRMRHALVPNN